MSDIKLKERIQKKLRGKGHSRVIGVRKFDFRSYDMSYEPLMNVLTIVCGDTFHFIHLSYKNF